MLIIVFFGGLILGVLLGVLIMSLLFLAQKGDKDKELPEYHLDAPTTERPPHPEV